MAEIRVGDQFRDVQAPNRRWRVVGARDGLFELASVERPNLSRFQTASKLLDAQLYAPEPPAAVADATEDGRPLTPMPIEAAGELRKVLIVLRRRHPDVAGKLGAGIARALSADIGLVMIGHASADPTSAGAPDRDGEEILAQARDHLGLPPATPAFGGKGFAADVVVRAAEAWAPNLIVMDDRDLTLVEAVLRRAGCAVLVAPRPSASDPGH